MSNENIILVLYDSPCDVHAFLQRLIDSPNEIDETVSVVPWHIDNKYYTADVQLRILDAGSSANFTNDAPVVLYLFEGAPPSPLPPNLTKLLLSEPRDVALAVRLEPSPPSAHEDETDGPAAPGRAVTVDEDLEDVFDELGMELVDETALHEDDDERSVLPIEIIRQALMTHMWPSMVRRGQAAAAVTLDLSDYDVPDGADTAADHTRPSFPVTFTSDLQPSSDAAGSASFVVLDKPDLAFPDLGELRAQVEESRSRATEDDSDLDDTDADEAREPGAEEYARLDEWLDEDDDELGRDFMPVLIGQEGASLPLEDEAGPSQSPSAGTVTRDPATRAAVAAEEQFDDDFDDFAAFQSAPSGPSKPRADATAGGVTGLDPTPLLLHLQAVRAELSGVENADERRARAGKEVLRVMRDLGMGGGLEEDDLDDLDDFADVGISR